MVTGYLKIKGCRDADKLLERQSYCEDCPFRECIYELKPKEKGLIMNFQVIQGILGWVDAGIEPAQISKWYKGISVNQIKNWLKNREHVLAKLEKYAPCC